LLPICIPIAFTARTISPEQYPRPKQHKQHDPGDEEKAEAVHCALFANRKDYMSALPCDIISIGIRSISSSLLDDGQLEE